jgi:hypothetical protein
VIIKARSLDSPRRLIQSLIGLSQHARQWRGATRVAERGIAASACAALLRTGRGARRLELLILEAAAGKTVFEWLAQRDLDFAAERDLALAVGDFLRQFHRGGLLNRDGKPSNLMAAKTERGWSLTVLDTVAIRRTTPTEAGLVRMLRDLCLEPSQQGCFPRRTVAMRVIAAAAGSDTASRSWRHGLWRACHAAMVQHQRHEIGPR